MPGAIETPGRLPGPACPDNETLSRLLAGRLTTTEAERIERHLEGCPSCLARLGGLSAHDRLLDAVRGWASEPGAADEPATIASLVRRLCQPARAGAARSSTPTLPAAGRVAALADRFERAWEAATSPDQRPRLADYLQEAPETERAALLSRMIALDIAYRRRAGQHPKAADYRELVSYLDQLPFVRTFDVPPATAGPKSDGPPAQPAPARPAIHIRCPHCHNPIQLVDDRPDEVLCPGCGSSFRLRDARPTTTQARMRLLGKFQLLERVGVGAFGAVWRARDTELDRIVALKIPHADSLSDEADLERFAREARAAAQLRHPGIVTVHEVQMLEGRPAIVSDFIDGLPLKDLMELRRLTFREAAALIVDVAEALDYAHGKGLVHRDIKPANIMIEYPRSPVVEGGSAARDAAAPGAVGKPLVMDFGLARRDQAEVTLTLEGHILGTPAYMCPEQAAGQGHQADRRSDVYSLGVILYELLTGELPFRGTKLMLLHQVLHDEPRAPRRLNDKIPADLETICLKAMAKEPAQRYASAAALAEDLRCFLADRPIRARRASLAERAWRWCRRNPALAALAIAVLALMLALTTGSLIAAYVFQSQRDQLGQEAQRLEEANRQTSTALWKSNYAQARAFRRSGLGGRRFEALRALAEAIAIHPTLRPEDWGPILGRPLTPAEAAQISSSLLLRNEAIASMALTDLRVVQEWQGLSRPDIEEPIDFRPDLDAYARAEADGNICIRRIGDDGIALRLPVVGKSVCRPIQFSPDGRWLAVKQGTENGTEFFLWDVTNQGAVRQPVLRGPTRHDLGTIDFSPDGRWLAVDAPDGSIGLYDLTTGKEAQRLRPASPPLSVRFDPSSAKLATSSLESHTVQIWDVKAERVVRTLTHPRGVVDTAWSPDGRLLAAAGAYPDNRVHVWDAESDDKLAALEGHKADVVQVAFHPHADLLVSYGWDGKTRLWDFRGGRELLAVDGWFLRFSRDGRHLAFRHDRQVGLWEVVTAEECRPLYGHDRMTAVHSSAFRPDGRLLATAAGDGVRLWDALAGRQVATVKELGETDTVAFDPVSGGLFTCARMGLYLWPVRAPAGETEGRYQIGPPVPFSLPGPSTPLGLSVSQDGNVLAVRLGSWQTVVIHRREGKRVVLNGLGMVSPDGQWVATGGFRGSDHINVWDSRTGERKCNIPTGGVTEVAFSPDNQWLVLTTGAESQFYRVGSWQPRPPADLPAGLGRWWATTYDGQMMAVGSLKSGLVRLVLAGTGQELATLEITPSPSRFTGLPTFSPDGSQLVIHYGHEGLRVWDLRKVRARLATMGLDWDQPPYPPLAAAAPKPLQVQVGGAELAADPRKMWQHQVGQQVLALWRNPYSALAHFRLGTLLLREGQNEKAYTHLSLALAFRPQLTSASHNRALVGFRLGRWSQVVADADRVLKDQVDQTQMLYLRASACQKLGRHLEAIAGLSTLLARYPKDWVLYELRAESYAALGDSARAEADGAKARELAPKDAKPLNERAWRLLTGPAGPRDPGEALVLSRRAVELEPNNAMFLNTLGVAQYRNGLYREAVATLETSLAAGQGRSDAFDLFFLAMCHHRLGDPTAARDCYARAVAWWQQQKGLSANQAAELKAFQAEADALLQGR